MSGAGATASRIAARYRSGPHDGPEPATSPVIDLALQHRSVREFLPTPLADGELESIVAAAQSASQSSNLQGREVMRERLREQGFDSD